MAGMMGSMMRPPKWIQRDSEVAVKKVMINGYQDEKIPVFVFEPYGVSEDMPCLVYYHGGGFFFEGAPYHYRLAKTYA